MSKAIYKTEEERAEAKRARVRKAFKKHYQKNRDVILANERDRYHNNRETRLANNQRWCEENKEYANASRRQRLYGLTADQYQSLVTAHDNQCAICSAAAPESKSLDIDHNHQTSKVRGLLCRRCNVGIGIFEDNPELLKQAIQYLERGQ
jgi:hypothetical protein